MSGVLLPPYQTHLAPLSVWTAACRTISSLLTVPGVLSVPRGPGPVLKVAVSPAIYWMVSGTLMTAPPVCYVQMAHYQALTLSSAWTAPAGTPTTPTLTRPGVLSALVDRQPRRIISSVRRLTGRGRRGEPGASAPSLVLGRTDKLEQNIVNVNVSRLNTGERTAIQQGLRRVRDVEGKALT